MGEDTSPPTPNEVGERLRRIRAAQSDEAGASGLDASGKRPALSGLGAAMRIGVELVSALIVGVGIGYGLDHFLGTRPWLMVLFFFLGSAAGILNVWRAVSGQGYAVGYRDEDDGGKNKD
ncbi:MAG: AtpZ/AtpI family protein [Alphaproteobacteria bacterium]|jgi:ATP synthase protein I|nr:AtpZ/AtpI family protein [Alphaproteobacteria bacterium]